MKSVPIQSLLQSAVALHRAGRIEEALAFYRRAAAGAPADPTCGMALAFALSALGRHADAEAGLRPLAARHPRHAELLDLWGVILQRCGRQTEAIAATRQAVTASPTFARGWNNLGLALLNGGRAADALGAFARVGVLEPKRAGGHHGRAMALQQLGRIPEAVEAYGRAIALDPTNFESRSYRLMALHYLDGVTREQLWAEHQAFGAALPAAGRPAFAKASAGRTRNRLPSRLKVGFLSPDLRDHSVAYFLEPILAHLDRDQFDVVLYHDHFIVDAVSARLQRNASWRHLVGLTSERAEQIIRADELDILVDLAGHTGLNRLPLLARRLAPVQISYLGYPDTTGVPAIDFRLVDETTDPRETAAAFHSERLVRLAPTAWTYAPPAEAPECAPAAERAPVFGSCNNLAKLSAETLRGWSAVLRSVPASRLLLKNVGLSDSDVASDFRRRLEEAQIDLSRVELAERTATVAEHLAFYSRIDVALDTFPYHGTTTTCEALWMGVPVVSLQGDRHCARVGGSLLAAAGHPEWAVASWPEYARCAAELAERRPDRSALRRQMASSSLLDHAGGAARFGAALLQCWTEGVGRDRSLAA